MREAVWRRMVDLIRKRRRDWIEQGYSGSMVDSMLKMAKKQAQSEAGRILATNDYISVEDAQEQALPKALNWSEEWGLNFIAGVLGRKGESEESKLARAREILAMRARRLKQKYREEV